MNESNDEFRLRELLRESRTRAPLPPRFPERVWRRIESAERMSAPAFSLARWLGAWFARPAFAAVFVAMLVGIGVSAGYLMGGHKAAHWEAQLSSHYVASITAFAMDKTMNP